jgi:hypothetical protein
MWIPPMLTLQGACEGIASGAVIPGVPAPTQTAMSSPALRNRRRCLNAMNGSSQHCRPKSVQVENKPPVAFL